MIVEPCTGQHLEQWVRLRQALWTEATEQELRLEATAILERPDDGIAFIGWAESAEAIAFAEASLRRDYVNGCGTYPVGFLEGLYVDEAWRGRGIARTLCCLAEDWAASRGCSEFASDVLLDNETSQRAHEALGFEETERVVYYLKSLRR